MAMTTCGEAIPKLLSEYGADIVFGIPGTHSIELYRGLADGRLKHVLARHEQGAAFMADGYAQIAGRPAVCCFITGPGLTNAATGIAQAYSSSIPMLVITPVNERASLGKGWGRLHELTDQSAVVKPFTAFSETVMSPDELPGLVSRAYEVFQSKRPRPVHIEIPIDVFKEPASGQWTAVLPPPPPGPDSALIGEAVAKLSAASRPVMVVGGGAWGSVGKIEALAERLDAPVASSYAGKGLIGGNHPLSMGGTLSLPGTQEIVGSADVVLAIGTEFSETDAWTSWAPINGDIIRIDIDRHELESDYPSAIAIEADADAAAQALLDELGAGRADNDGAARAGAARASNVADMGPLYRKLAVILADLRAALPDDTIVVGDMTQLIYAANLFMPFEPTGRYLGATGYGTLGYGLPAAIGAKLAAPDRPVAVIAGDSGVLYTIQEMATAVEEKLPIVLYLWNNRALGQIRDDMVEAQIRPFGVLPEPPDFQVMARSFGWTTTLVGQDGDIASLTRQALAHDGPTLIEIRDTEAWAT